MVDLLYLKTFTTVAEKCSFKIAAQRNFITQPAVSQHIRKLEQKLGHRLFDRHGRKVTLTKAGSVFLLYAQNILKLYADGKRQIDASSHILDGTIKVATTYSIGLYGFQKTLAKFLQEHPNVDVQLEYDTTEAIYEKLFNQNIDFGVVSYPKQVPGIRARIITTEKLIFVQSNEKKVLSQKCVKRKDLNSTHILTFSQNTPTGKAIHQFFSKHEIPPQNMRYYNNIETLKSAIKLGLGCAIVPEQTVSQELKNKIFSKLTLRGFQLTRPIGIIYLENKIFSDLTRKFCELVATNGHHAFNKKNHQNLSMLSASL